MDRAVDARRSPAGRFGGWRGQLLGTAGSGLQVASGLGMDGLVLVKPQAGADTKAVDAALGGNPNVAWSEANAVVTASQVPNDTVLQPPVGHAEHRPDRRHGRRRHQGHRRLGHHHRQRPSGRGRDRHGRGLQPPRSLPEYLDQPGRNPRFADGKPGRCLPRRATSPSAT